MKWNIGVRRGDDDTFSPRRASGDGVLFVTVDGRSSPYRVREHVLSSITDNLGKKPSSVIADLLNVALTVYSADLTVSRSLAGDDWTRSFMVDMPVDDLALWCSAKASLESTLEFLSGDHWSFRFRSHPQPESNTPRVVPDSRQFDEVCLFSGGVDSLVGALDLLASGKRVLLVGHYGGGSTSRFQREVYDIMRTKFEEAVYALRFQVLPPQVVRQDADAAAEETQRSRSFLFFALGLTVADALAPEVPLFVPENGLISLNVPMTGSRSGSASTRTTHPYYVKCFRSLLAALGARHDLVLPYRFKTKAEMIKECAAPELLRQLVPMTISCAHPDQRRRQRLSPGGHCGHCFPCILRRATVAEAGFPDASYDLDLLTSRPSAKTKTGENLRAVRLATERLSTMSRHKLPFEVLKSGPIPAEEIRRFADVYRRGMNELSRFYGP